MPLTLTTNYNIALRRLVRALDWRMRREGRAWRLFQTPEEQEELRNFLNVDDVSFSGGTRHCLGHCITCLVGQPWNLSYRKVWELCRLDLNPLLIEQKYWYDVEIVKVLYANRPG